MASCSRAAYAAVTVVAVCVCGLATASLDVPDDASGFAVMGNFLSGTFISRAMLDGYGRLRTHLPATWPSKVFFVGNAFGRDALNSTTVEATVPSRWTAVHRGVRRTRFYPSVGHLDYVHGAAGVDAVRTASRRYESVFSLPDTATYYATVFGGVQPGRPVAPSVRVVTIDTLDWNEDQQEWLYLQLAQAAEDFVFVVGHYPLISNGPAGDVMADTTLPQLLAFGNVSAYISGQDASMQHLVDPASGLTTLVVGSSGVAGTPVTFDTTRLHYSSANNGYLVCFGAEATGGHYTCQFRDCDNHVKYSTTFQPRAWDLAAVNKRTSGECWANQVVLGGLPADDPTLEALRNSTAYLLQRPQAVVVSPA